jgi:hypothetical protein
LTLTAGYVLKLWVIGKRVGDDPGFKGPRVQGFEENQKKLT